MCALAGGVDGRVVDGVERALRERRERPDLLELVPEELDAERLASGAREDVDEAAAHGDLAALLDPLDALVAGERERLDELVEPGAARLREHDDVGPIRLRRNPLRERARGDADEPAAREDVERARALADEVRGRLETGSGVHAAAREERDAIGVDVPADGLGDVARLLVLGEQADERPPELAVQRREEERERGLRDARVRREVVRERAEALARGERVDETGER